MGGALTFVAVVFAVVVFGTYLLQAALLALQVAIWLTIWVVRIGLGLVSLAVFGVWAAVDRPAALRAWRGEGSGKPAPWARGL